jgi:hypothetical protein
MYLALPALFFKFWYLEAPRSLFFYLLSMDNAFLHMLSLPLFVRTFFKPLKNEYRGDLVGFSIAMGMVVKSLLLVVGLGLFVIMLFVQTIFYLLFLALPLLPVLAVFITL